MFGWSRKSWSTSGFAGAWGYWGLSLRDFYNFFILHISEVEDSNSCSSKKLPCSGDLEKPRSTSGFLGALGYWWLSLMDFRNFFILYIFEVKKSISRSFAKLKCSGDLENPGQLPVSQVPESTDDWDLWIFVILSFSTFSRLRNPFLAVSQS